MAGSECHTAIDRKPAGNRCAQNPRISFASVVSAKDSVVHRLTQVFVTLVVSTVLVAGISLTARADAPAPAQFTPAALVPAGSQEIDSIRNSNKPWLPGQDSRFSSQDALPVLFILGLVARLGIKWVIKWQVGDQVVREDPDQEGCQVLPAQ